MIVSEEEDSIESLKKRNILLRNKVKNVQNRFFSSAMKCRELEKNEIEYIKELIELHKKYDFTITLMMLSWSITLVTITSYTLGLV